MVWGGLECGFHKLVGNLVAVWRVVWGGWGWSGGGLECGFHKLVGNLGVV